MFLRQSSTQTVVVGPVLDSTGAAVTTAVVTNFSLAKNGTAAAFTTETLTSLGNGYYSLALTTSNTNTLGIAAVFVNATTMSMTVFRWNVIAASVYDAIVNNATNASGGLLTATGAISALSGEILNTANLPTNFASLAITVGGATTVGAMAANTLTASALASDAVAEIAAAVVDGGDAQQATLLLVKAKTDLITSDTVFVTVDRVAGSTITMHYNESTSVNVPLDEDTTSLTLRFVVENAEQTDVLVIENANIARTLSQFTVTITTAVTATLGQYRWALRDITGGINRLIKGGVLQVISAANKDA